MKNTPVYFLLIAAFFCAQARDNSSTQLGKRYYFYDFSVFIPAESGCSIEKPGLAHDILLNIRFSSGDRINAIITISYFKSDLEWDSLPMLLQSQEKFLGLPDSTILLTSQPYGTLGDLSKSNKAYSATDAYQYCGTDEELIRRQKAAQIAQTSGIIATTVIANLVLLPIGYVIIPLPGARSEMPPPVRRCRYIISHLRALNNAGNPVISIMLTTNEVNSIYSHYMRAVISSVYPGKEPVHSEKPYVPFSSTLSAIKLADGTQGKGFIEGMDSSYIHFRKYDSKTIVKLPKHMVKWFLTGQDTTYIDK